MIEMLGVLAIIGVLSAGGIWGYNAAMNSHYSNSLIYSIELLNTNLATLYKRSPIKEETISARNMYSLGLLSSDFEFKSTSTDWFWFKKDKNTSFTMSVLTYIENTPEWNYSCSSQISNPTTYFSIDLYGLKTDVCTKIATHNWNSGSTKKVLIQIGQKHCQNAPFSTALAERYCSVKNSHGRIDIDLHFVYY